MTWAAVNPIGLEPERGEVHFTDGALREQLEAAATAAGWLLVPVEPPRPAQRGRLALLIESAVEEQLDRRGAPPPGVGASSDLDASLSDQLYRARLVGSTGLALSLHSLEGIANLAGSLDAEDSAVLRWWLAATRERPVRLLLAVDDRGLGVYAEPVALRALLDGTPRPTELATDSAPSAAPEVVASTSTMDLSELPPAVAQAAASIAVPSEPEPTPPPASRTEAQRVSDTEALMQAMAAIFADEDSDDFATAAATESEKLSQSLALAVREIASDPFVEAATEPGPEVAPVVDAEPPSPEPEMSAEPEMPAEPEPSPEPGAVLSEQPEAAEPAVASSPRPTVPVDPAVLQDCERWVRELEGTRGPKPLAVVERTFVSAFVPLRDAVERGSADEAAARVLQTWATSFEKSYSEAFDALRVRGKRPTMVLDVPDIALRIGRLHGARSVQLVLVDGMRFDLGMRVNERLRPLLDQHATLTERLLLWTALPSTTKVQLELLGRGPQGLRDLAESADSEVPVARGRSAATLRRVRSGHREVLKLDLVESALSVPGAPLAERLDCLADEVAGALSNHLLKLPPRTLVLVFGDHGFVTESQGAGTSAGRSGGASPEEVLVPAFAWLVGAVH